MILPKRTQRTHVSYPMNSELAPCFSTPELLASPPTTPPRGHKHSFSKPMSWLNRSSSSTSSHSTPHAASKPTRISEPKGGSSLEQFHFHRSGPLGSGATIVRTPQEALSGSTRPFGLISEDGVESDTLLHDTEKSETRFLPSLPPSPPLPPLPDIPDTEGLGDRLSGSPSSIPLSDHAPHPRSLGSQSPAAHPSSQPTLLAHPRVSSRSIPSPPPVDTDVIPPQPPFEPILLSPIPDGAIDPSKFIVTLETCTTTFRTSLRSLVSRPSHLSRYITSLLSPVSETASIYSNASDASSVPRSNGFNSVFRDHLASSGLLSQPPTGIHIFLDRPSAPYAHVLAYLRSLPSTPGHPEALPRAVQLLGSATPCRFESLLELCDEARYLGLAELEKLCCYEMHRFQRSLPSTSACGLPRGQTGSVHSSHTLVERCQSRQEVRPSEPQVPKGNSGGNAVRSAPRESSSGSSFENKDAAIRERTRQGRGFKHEAGPPPPGWI